MTDSDTERLLRMELLEMSRALAAVVASVGGEVVLHDDLLTRMPNEPVLVTYRREHDGAVIIKTPLPESP